QPAARHRRRAGVRLVAPVGADLERLESDLVDLLGLYGYATNPLRLSAPPRKKPRLAVELQEAPEVDRINSYMNAGNKGRERSNSEAILAAWALLQIRNASSRSDREEDSARATKKVVFESFMGIGPRRFFDLFSIKLSNGYPLKRKQRPDGAKVKWKVSN